MELREVQLRFHLRGEEDQMQVRVETREEMSIHTSACRAVESRRCARRLSSRSGIQDEDPREDLGQEGIRGRLGANGDVDGIGALGVDEEKGETTTNRNDDFAND